MKDLIEDATKETNSLFKELMMETFHRNENLIKIGADLDVLSEYVSDVNYITKSRSASQNNAFRVAVEPSENIQKEISELEILIEKLSKSEMKESIIEEDFNLTNLEELAKKKKLLLEEQEYLASMGIKEADSLINSLQTILIV